MTRTPIALLGVLTLGFGAAAASPAMAASVKGTYGCSKLVGQAMLPTDARLTLTSTGRYRLQLISVGGGKSGGTYKKKGAKLTFKSGLLNGKSGTFGKNKTFGTGYQIKFKSWLNNGKNELCSRA